LFHPDFNSFLWQAVASEHAHLSTPCGLYDAAWLSQSLSALETDEYQAFLEKEAGLEAAACYTSIRVATSYLLDVYLHGSDLSQLSVWKGVLGESFSRHAPAAAWLLLTMMDRQGAKLRSCLVECSVREVRAAVASLCMEAMSLLAEHESEHAKIGTAPCTGRERGTLRGWRVPIEKDEGSEEREEDGGLSDTPMESEWVDVDGGARCRLPALKPCSDNYHIWTHNPRFSSLRQAPRSDAKAELQPRAPNRPPRLPPPRTRGPLPRSQLPRAAGCCSRGDSPPL